ncbi:MAG: cell division protein ZapA [candidate division WOR-3 bacterium]
MNNYVVKVFGSEYNVRSDQDADYVLKVAELVDRKMKEISSRYQPPNTAKTAVLACLALVDEHLQATAAEQEWLRRRVGALIEKLDRVIQAPCSVRDSG